MFQNLSIIHLSYVKGYTIDFNNIIESRIFFQVNGKMLLQFKIKGISPIIGRLMIQLGHYKTRNAYKPLRPPSGMTSAKNERKLQNIGIFLIQGA